MEVKSRVIGKIKRKFINDEFMLQHMLDLAAHYDARSSGCFQKEVQEDKIIFYTISDEQLYARAESETGDIKEVPIGVNYDTTLSELEKELKDKKYKYSLTAKVIKEKEKHEYIVEILD